MITADELLTHQSICSPPEQTESIVSNQGRSCELNGPRNWRS